jgi:HEPN domain-containing protein
MTKLTREWVDKAENDLRAAQALHGADDHGHEVICFHCQQCAEKYVKAVLQEASVAIPRTHDLEELSLLVLPHHAEVRRFRRGLVLLSQFAVETRYPNHHVRKRQAVAALRWAERVRAACRALLGVRPRRKKSP